MRYKFIRPVLDLHNSHKSHMEICHFMVYLSLHIHFASWGAKYLDLMDQTVVHACV